MSGVRDARFIREIDGELSLRCRGCQEWWPITREFWMFDPQGHVRASRCIACERERKAAYMRGQRVSEKRRQQLVAAQRRYRQWLAATHPDLVREKNRERYLARREYHIEYARRRREERAA